MRWPRRRGLWRATVSLASSHLAFWGRTEPSRSPRPHRRYATWRASPPAQPALRHLSAPREQGDEAWQRSPLWRPLTRQTRKMGSGVGTQAVSDVGATGGSPHFVVGSCCKRGERRSPLRDNASFTISETIIRKVIPAPHARPHTPRSPAAKGPERALVRRWQGASWVLDISYPALTCRLRRGEPDASYSRGGCPRAALGNKSHGGKRSPR